MLFNEPKLLKSNGVVPRAVRQNQVSVLFNEPKLLKSSQPNWSDAAELRFSALQRAEIAEINDPAQSLADMVDVSVLFNEPKLLKFTWSHPGRALVDQVSVLFNEPKLLKSEWPLQHCSSLLFGFSALQRAEIAEIRLVSAHQYPLYPVSVLFNEPKLLKS